MRSKALTTLSFLGLLVLTSSFFNPFQNSFANAPNFASAPAPPPNPFSSQNSGTPSSTFPSTPSPPPNPFTTQKSGSPSSNIFTAAPMSLAPTAPSANPFANSLGSLANSAYTNPATFNPFMLNNFNPMTPPAGNYGAQIAPTPQTGNFNVPSILNPTAPQPITPAVTQSTTPMVTQPTTPTVTQPSVPQTPIKFSSPPEVGKSIIKNGDFSQNSCSANKCVWPSGTYKQAFLPGWLPVTEMEIGRGPVYNSNFGPNTYVAQIGPTINTGIKQNLGTLGAGRFALSFEYATRQGEDFSKTKFTVHIANVQIGTIQPTNYQVTKRSVYVDIPYGTNNGSIKFRGLSNSDTFGVAVKNIAFSYVGESQTEPKKQQNNAQPQIYGTWLSVGQEVVFPAPVQPLEPQVNSQTIDSSADSSNVINTPATQTQPNIPTSAQIISTPVTTVPVKQVITTSTQPIGHVPTTSSSFTTQIPVTSTQSTSSTPSSITSTPIRTTPVQQVATTPTQPTDPVPTTSSPFTIQTLATPTQTIQTSAPQKPIPQSSNPQKPTLQTPSIPTIQGPTVSTPQVATPTAPVIQPPLTQQITTSPITPNTPNVPSLSPTTTETLDPVQIQIDQQNPNNPSLSTVANPTTGQQPDQQLSECCSSQIIKNGGFEINSCTQGWCTYNQQNYQLSDLPGWIPYPEIDIGKSVVFSSEYPTSNVMELDPNRNVCAYQTLKPCGSGEYILKFDYTARNPRGEDKSLFTAKINGNDVLTFNQSSQNVIQKAQIIVNLDAGQNYLIFCGQGSSDFYATVDNVSLTCATIK